MFWLKNIVLFSITFQKLCQSQEWQPLNPSHIFQNIKIWQNHKFPNSKQFVVVPTYNGPLPMSNLKYHIFNINPPLTVVSQATTKTAAESIDFRKPKTQNYYKATLIESQTPVYEFRYKVNDPKANNYQEKFETRVGDAVKGYYSVKEPNGYVRLVKYVSDKNGFRTQVSHHHTDHNGGNGPASTHIK